MKLCTCLSFALVAVLCVCGDVEKSTLVPTSPIYVRVRRPFLPCARGSAGKLIRSMVWKEFCHGGRQLYLCISGIGPVSEVLKKKFFFFRSGLSSVVVVAKLAPVPGPRSTGAPVKTD